MEIVDILQAIAVYFGLDFSSLLAMAGAVILAVNFLKGTPPFSGWVKGNVIYFVTFGLSLLISAITMWGMWIPMLIATLIMGVLAIGGWASLKMIAHKSNRDATSPSGGVK